MTTDYLFYFFIDIKPMQCKKLLNVYYNFYARANYYNLLFKIGKINI